MNIFKLLIGILLILLPVNYLIYSLKNIDETERFDYMDFSYNIKIYGGLLMLFILGVVMIFGAFQHCHSERSEESQPSILTS